MPSTTDLVSRRALLGLMAAGALVATTPLARADAASNATSLVKKISADVSAILGSGKSEAAALKDFQSMFRTHADVDFIARSVLGAPWRQASNGQKTAFTSAFEGYLSRKYGKQFNAYRGAKIEVTKTSDQGKKGVVVSSLFSTGKSAPIDVSWHVSDRSGKSLMINLYIEGVSMLSTERSEVQAILSKNRGDLDKLIADLNTRG